MFNNNPDFLELLMRNTLKTSGIKYKKLYHWMYSGTVNVVENNKISEKVIKTIGESKYFHRKV